MDLLQQSAQAWKEITEYRYLFTYGYKKQLYPINLTFSLEDYPHLAGFQYMKDISLPNYSSSKIADRILEGKILFEKVQKAAQYEEMIKPRLEALVHLKESLDNKFNLYSYMPRMYPFITGIKADYLISSHFSVDNFIFIIKANAQGELKCDFLCCSIFEKGDRELNVKVGQFYLTINKKKPRIVRYYNSGLRSLLQVFLELLFAYRHYIICKSENQYTDKWEIEKKNILFFWNKKCECILKPMRFSRLVKCGRIHIENTNERLSR